MDTIPESAATTLVRIEVLVIQGVCRAVLILAAGIIIIPVLTVMLAIGLTKRELESAWKKIALLPWRFLRGFGMSVIAPFMAFWRGLKETAIIVSAEWRERWRNGTAMRPDGTAMDIPTDEEKRVSANEAFFGVLEEYLE